MLNITGCLPAVTVTNDALSCFGFFSKVIIIVTVIELQNIHLLMAFLLMSGNFQTLKALQCRIRVEKVSNVCCEMCNV